MNSIQLISVLVIFSVTLIAGSYPFLKKLTTPIGNDFPMGEALASGIFLGAGLIHMLGDASADFLRLGFHYPLAPLLASIVFLILLLFEHIARELVEHNSKDVPSFAILAVIVLSFHSFLAGAALGLSQAYSVFFVMFIAIIAHKWAASFALSVEINKSKLSFKSGVSLFLLFAIMLPLGVLFGHLITHHLNHYPILEPIFSALAAGTFLYLGTLHGLKRAVMIDKCCNLKNFSFVILGFSIMSIVAIWT